MRVLVLGGTGSIGPAVTRELVVRSNTVLALARSDGPAARAAGLGASAVIRGDIATPESWVARLSALDAVIHMACDFGSPIGMVDLRLLDHLLPQLASNSDRPRFVYTGGCWLFGATGDTLATERSRLSPLPVFAWMVPHADRILGSKEVAGIVVHPGMAYGSNGEGVFRRFSREAIERSCIRVVGNESVHWPLVHADDLAVLYVLALERAPAGESYIGVATEGLAVGRIARAFAHRFGTRLTEPEIVPVDAIARELGEWARGYALHQRLSGAKARHDLGWTPEHVDPEAAIARLSYQLSGARDVGAVHPEQSCEWPALVQQAKQDEAGG